MESKTLNVKGKSYVLIPRDLEIMSLNEITMQGLRTRLLNGWNFRDAIDAPSGMRREEYQNEKMLADKYKMQQELDLIVEQRRRVKRREDKKRREEMLAKHRVRTRYFEELEKNNLIARIKTDCYGRVQRG
ncbi:SA1788 family PVL leukocidin-associated protein [Staphylococcus pasteuri]|uniref:SA1788 family PVL leukocidin-associated protein n=1 Tax=Staphylococcus pasteuri TaxID=45972 RepID=UPI0012B79DB4|nr:SA1788 family PVL leukocidin-associated protein [Staphylococcus pasteuri]